MLETVQTLINQFYPRPRHLFTDVTVTMSDRCEAYYNEKTDTITFGEPLLDMFYEARLPKFALMYHEAGHRWFSHDVIKLFNQWKNLTHITPVYDKKYHHLMNWIEDFYIEEKVVKEYPFLTDIVSCLRMVPSKDLTSIKHVFNYLYITGQPSPAFMDPKDQQDFIDQFNRLFNLRRHPNFGMTPLSQFVARQSIEMMFIEKLVEFYDWLVLKDVFDKDVPLPPSPHPIVTTNVQTPGKQNGNGNGNGNSVPKPTLNGTSVGGTSTTYTTKIGGVRVTYNIPQHNNKTLIKMYREERQRFVGRIDTNNSTLDGVFNGKFVDSNLMSNHINIKHCFEPKKLLDEMIFKKKERCFNNVSIYRDVSGSTHDDNLFSLINNVCAGIIKEIPIQYHFYLYASGDVSILELPFISWDDENTPPEVYTDNEDFRNLGSGTNSGAIANVIAEQFNDKHLNIVVTDGDLHNLFKRDDLNALLQNVFTIFVGIDETSATNYTEKMKPNSYIFIKDESDIPMILNKIADF